MTYLLDCRCICVKYNSIRISVSQVRAKELIYSQSIIHSILLLLYFINNEMLHTFLNSVLCYRVLKKK